MGGSSSNPLKVVEKTVKKLVKETGDVLSDATNLILDPFGTVKDFLKPKEQAQDTNIDTSAQGFDDISQERMPSYTIDTAAAKRRKRALALQRGLMSTRSNIGEDETISTLTPSLQGKQKLGQ